MYNIFCVVRETGTQYQHYRFPASNDMLALLKFFQWLSGFNEIRYIDYSSIQLEKEENDTFRLVASVEIPKEIPL